MSNDEKEEKITCGLNGCKTMMPERITTVLKKRRIDWLEANDIPDLWGIDLFDHLCSMHWQEFMDQILRYKEVMTVSMKQDKELDSRIRTLLCEICGDLKEFDSVLKKT